MLKGCQIHSQTAEHHHHPSGAVCTVGRYSAKWGSTCSTTFLYSNMLKETNKKESTSMSLYGSYISLTCRPRQDWPLRFQYRCGDSGTPAQEHPSRVCKTPGEEFFSLTSAHGAQIECSSAGGQCSAAAHLGTWTARWNSSKWSKTAGRWNDAQFWIGLFSKYSSFWKPVLWGLLPETQQTNNWEWSKQMTSLD